MIPTSLLVVLLHAVVTAQGWLGVFVESKTPGPGERGVLVVRIIEDGPAEAAGLKKGDRILRIDDVDLLKFEDLGKALHQAGDGKEVRLLVLREDEEMALPLVLGKRPSKEEMERQWVIAAPEGILSPPSRLERIRRGFLGVDVLPLTEGLMEYFRAEGGGVLVSRVTPDSPAEKGGILAGDVITVVNGSLVESPVDLQKEIRELSCGETAEIAILREGKRIVRTAQVVEKEVEAYYFSAEGLRQPQFLLELERGREAYDDAMKKYEQAMRLQLSEAYGQEEFQEALRKHSQEYRKLLEEKEVLSKMEAELGAKLEALNAKLAELERKLREASAPQD
jgi:predicted metalloprotease with PDZ domain